MCFHVDPLALAWGEDGGTVPTLLCVAHYSTEDSNCQGYFDFFIGYGALKETVLPKREATALEVAKGTMKKKS